MRAGQDGLPEKTKGYPEGGTYSSNSEFSSQNSISWTEVKWFVILFLMSKGNKTFFGFDQGQFLDVIQDRG